MASSAAIADLVRDQVTSASTCTPATVALVNELLLPKSTSPKPIVPLATKKSSKVNAKTPTTKARTKNVDGQENGNNCEDGLSAKERSILATEIINLTLKTLTEAIRTSSHGTARKQASSKDLVKATARKTLRRSISLPQSPLQPRSLSRVASSPDISSRHSRSSSTSSSTISVYRSTAECARTAFACLRSLQVSKALDASLPPLQLENGMSVLIGKLLSLGLDDLAIKEIRILKRRLLPEVAPKKTSKPAAASQPPPPSLSELLDFGSNEFLGAKLTLVIATQLQLLRLLGSSRKYAQIEAALPIIVSTYVSSPIRLLETASNGVIDKKQIEKYARQFQSLSEILLSLCPSISSTEDEVAKEPKLSISPEVALQYQTLGLQARIAWWKIVGHNGDAAKDVFDPFLRCLSTFSRRSAIPPAEIYDIATSLYDAIFDCLGSYSELSTRDSSSTRAIYRLFGSIAKDAGMFSEAIAWTTRYGGLSDATSNSTAQRCAYIGRLVSLKLKQSLRDPDEEDLLLKLLDELESPFTGSVGEIDDMITEVTSARRAANGILSRSRGTSPAQEISLGLRDLCEALVFLCPRLLLRYLGPSPESNTATKDVVRYSQRVQLITVSALHTIDSVLFLLRVLSSEDRNIWESMDSRLQECLVLYERLESTMDGAKLDNGQVPPAYHVRISNMYYTHYLNMRKSTHDKKEVHSQQLRALRRSIECLRQRSATDKQSACLCTKLERMADIYKQSGRFDEMLETLTALRDELVVQGSLSSVVTSAATMPLSSAWMSNDETTTLGHVTQTIVRSFLKYSKSSTLCATASPAWSKDERAVVLENLLSVLSQSTDDRATRILQDTAQELLTIYNVQEYPYRRLRLLLQLYVLELDHDISFAEKMEEQVVLICKENVTLEKTQDGGLVSYLLNMQLLAQTHREVRQENPDIGAVKQAVMQWVKMRSSCDSLVSFEAKVESIPSLVTHLTTIADFLEIKGHDQLRLVVLRLITDINLLYELPNKSDALVRSLNTLGIQWLDLGYSGKAGLTFDKAKEYCRCGGVSIPATLQLHVLYSQYLLAIGNHDKCEEQMVAARTLFVQLSDKDSGMKASRSLQEKTQAYILAARAYSISASLALERGTAQLALNNAKSAVRLLRRAWAYIENQRPSQPRFDESTRLEINQNVSSVDVLETSAVSSNSTTSSTTTQRGPLFWSLITPLYMALNFVAKIYTHNGLYPETHHYLQEAHKLASITGSGNHIAISSALLGSTYLNAGLLDKGSEHLALLTSKSLIAAEGRAKAMLLFQTGIMHGKLGDHTAEITAYDSAYKLLFELTRSTYIQKLDQVEDDSDMLVEEMAQLVITKRKKAAPLKAPVRPKKAPLRKAVVPQVPSVEPQVSITEQCPGIAMDQATILRRKAQTLIALNKLDEVNSLLQDTEHGSNCQTSIIDQKIAVAKQLLQQSMEQMAVDPVYSVLQESTLSYPAIASLTKSEKAGERLVVIRTSPAAKKSVRNDRTRGRSKSPMPDSFFDRLRRAQEYLIDVHSLACAAGSISTVHHVAVLLNSVSMLLSAFGHSKTKLLAHPGFASCSIETARNLALRRERRVIQNECDTPGVIDSTSWPCPRSIDARRSSISFSNDNNRFQQTYVDIIPKAWTTISIALSDSRDELSITKFEAGHSPFVLRLPLGRHNSMDADEEVFGFEQGQSEILEIIQLANESAHDARDMHTKEARESWWDEREALDARLRDLLENIEKVWLGGFTGIFSQHARRSDLLARFQKSFQNILDRHLPSRRKAGKKAHTQRVTLDSRILELFIGLGDASDEESDFSEPLADLLNFVIDVLQFHGEQNEYAEIDFDTIVIETQDALRGYHAAVHSSMQADSGRHTILILDKALHSFPWESLPCMQGQAVSRLPSLSSLRDRIVQQQADMPDDGPPGQYIHRHSGQYILNPSGDLKSTQTVFSKSLQGLMWDGIVRRIPKEEEIKTALIQKDLYLYFGHGSGAQYIRAKEIRRLEKCAVTWLMGCSSGALVNAGEFEPYGPAMNYVHAGCPALVATLWDVTDKDIDRFAKSAFEHWGLFEKEAGVKGKGRKKLEVVGEEGGEKMSLVEAVSKGKEACNLRYLNAAAVCVYGIPVYFK